MRTTSIMRRCWAPALAVTLLASAGCRRSSDEVSERDQSRTPTTDQTMERSEQQTEQAYEQAREAQQRAQEKTEEVIGSQEEVTEQRQEMTEQREELTEAQQQMQQQQQEAQQAQQRAQQEAAQAQEQAQAAQERAQQAQQETRQDLAQDPQPPPGEEAAPTPTGPVPTGATIAQGTVETASPNEVVIRSEAGDTLRLDVDPQTTVLKDGEPATLGDLEQGAKVKVSYTTEQGQTVATRIEAGAPADEG